MKAFRSPPPQRTVMGNESSPERRCCLPAETVQIIQDSHRIDIWGVKTSPVEDCVPLQNELGK